MEERGSEVELEGQGRCREKERGEGKSLMGRLKLQRGL